MSKADEEQARAFMEHVVGREGSEVEKLRRVAEAAVELAEEGWGYASEYFRNKWDSAARIAAIRAALRGLLEDA